MDITIINKYVENYNKNNFNIDNEDSSIKDFYKILLDNKIIKLLNNNKIKKNINSTVYVGYLEVKNHFGFAYTNENSFYVHKTDNYFSGDLVVCIINGSFKGKNDEVKILGLLKRSDKNIICRVSKSKNLIILDEKFKSYTAKFLNDKELLSVSERQIIQLKVEDINKKLILGSLHNVVADANDPDLQMKIILATYEIDTEFLDTTNQEVENINEPSEKDFANRTDLTNMTFITIDGSDSKDLDDAVCLIKENDNYRLYVSIADVSHYVKESTSLDMDASSKATSVYFVDRVVPMLPKKLSNGICSLNPHLNRLTMTCEMLINNKGEVIDSKIYNSVINSKYRLTYKEVNDLIHYNKYKEDIKFLYSTLKEMDKLRSILNKKRSNRGSFNLEDKDAKFEVDENGMITNIKPVSRKNGEKLIEEFMIVANETVASTIFHMDLPFVYRIHDKPNSNKLKDLLDSFKLFNITIKGDFLDFKPQMFKQVLDQVDDSTNKRILSDIIVRSLSKAKYQTANIGHFGLASNNYTHFTSPIRRYPDLLVHRKLKQYLVEKQLEYKEEDINNLESLSKHSSKKEVNAIQASQKIEDMRKAAYMTQFVGNTYNATIASALDYGMFVELDNTVRGLIKYKNIKEFVRYNNTSILFSNDKTLKIGDKVQVILKETNENLGLVEFDLVGFTMIAQNKPINRKRHYKKPTKDNVNAKKKRRRRGKNESHSKK